MSSIGSVMVFSSAADAQIEHWWAPSAFNAAGLQQLTGDSMQGPRLLIGQFTEHFHGVWTAMPSLFYCSGPRIAR